MVGELKGPRNHECACPLSNLYYATPACNLITLAKISFKKMSLQKTLYPHML